jgi:hypothetical protein
MKLLKFTEKRWGTYPRCQRVTDGKQCENTVYSDEVCWNHYGTGVNANELSEVRDTRERGVGPQTPTSRCDSGYSPQSSAGETPNA